METLIFEKTNRYSLQDLILYFLRLGTLGFGGPVALVGYMHRDLVEKRKWIDDADYKEGLALSQIAPDPWRHSLLFTLDMFITEYLVPRWWELRLYCLRSSWFSSLGRHTHHTEAFP
jgi:hypothetical protein